MNLKPLGARVIAEVQEEEQTTASGILLPDTAKEKPQTGRILAVGTGHYELGHHVPLEVKVGDEIIFSKYGGTEVKSEGKDYLLLRESDILAIVGPSTAKAKK